MKTHTDLEKQALVMNDLFQDMIAALDADLETGSHHTNNAESERFAKRYHRLAKAMSQMGRQITLMLPEDY